MNRNYGPIYVQSLASPVTIPDIRNYSNITVGFVANDSAANVHCCTTIAVSTFGIKWVKVPLLLADETGKKVGFIGEPMMFINSYTNINILWPTDWQTDINWGMMLVLS